MVLGLHDDTAAQETQTAHNTGSHARGVKFIGPLKAVLRDNHEQGRAQCQQHVRANAGSLGAQFPLIANKGGKTGRSQQAQR